MELLHAIILGAVEGVTEFLPISSTAHLTITESILGYHIASPGVTAFTAVVQIGSIAAAVVYFWSDIVRIGTAWVKGIVDTTKRDAIDYRLGWAIIIGIIPTVVLALIFKNAVETVFRSLWWVVVGLIGWSVVLWYADRQSARVDDERQLSNRHAFIIGTVQAISLIPGVSRSGATMSAGLLLGYDRVAITRLSFFLGIPVLLAAGLLQAVTKFDDISAHGIGWTPTIVAMIVAFIAGYTSIAWLLRFVSTHTFSIFIWYRVILGISIALLLLTNTIYAT
jgi:undecaprenyl-diphosphatase